MTNQSKLEASAAAPAETATTPATQAPGGQSISHHDLDTSQLKKPLSPAVLSLVLKYGIKDLGSIQASGNGGRILKGDVLAHLNLIKPKPAPKPTLSIAPPRDQIVFAKVYIYKIEIRHKKKLNVCNRVQRRKKRKRLKLFPLL